MNQRGFTLIEMAIVLTVIGLLIGGGLVATGPLIDQTHATQTRNNLDEAESALALFAIRNSRLPCPADGSLTSASTTYGMEIITAGAPATCTGTPANSVIPWKTLGLDEQYSLDGWNNRISYFPAGGQSTMGWGSLVDGGTPGTATAQGCLYRNVTAAATRASYCDSPTLTTAYPAYPWGNYIAVYATTLSGTGYGTELTYPNSAATVTLSTVSSYGNRAAYVLISHGKSGYYGWNRGGTQNPAPAGLTFTLKALNAAAGAGTTGSLGFVQGPPSGRLSTPTIFFDDIVRWRSPAMIIQLCGSGACGNP